MGGLGVKNIVSFNVALLGKWRWWLLYGRDSLVVRVSLVEEFEEGGVRISWCSGEYSGRFWEDFLVAEVPLKDSYMRLGGRGVELARILEKRAFLVRETCD
ncbi:hypothetical protein Lal_00021118 [Lupinus albus]|nr:hypothetical protein Lal_00021118 [Lupinus albus]